MIPDFQRVEVSDTTEVADSTYVLSFPEPESAAGLEPGQFCMISPELHTSDVFLPRPFSYYRVVDSQTIQILFRTYGRATRWMASLVPGNRIGVFGPLGNTFTIAPHARRAVLVAGGIGLPPLVLLAERLAALDDPPEIDLLYGEHTGDRIIDIKASLPAGVHLHLCTEDGAVGLKGLVTDLFRPIIAECNSPPAVYTCGPNAMMAALAGLLAPDSVAVFEASTEENMACGKGICKSCVIPMVTQDGTVRYRYCCTDGPVFNGFEVKWPHS